MFGVINWKFIAPELEFLVRESSRANGQKRVRLEIFLAQTGIFNAGGQRFGEERQPRNSKPLPGISIAGIGTCTTTVGKLAGRG